MHGKQTYRLAHSLLAVVKQQVLYDGTLRARAMHILWVWSRPEANAMLQDGFLQLYTTYCSFPGSHSILQITIMLIA